MSDFTVVTHIITSVSTAIVAVGGVIVFFTNRDHKRHKQAIANATTIKHNLHISNDGIAKKLDNIEQMLKEMVKE